jgi:hypothetical protein
MGGAAMSVVDFSNALTPTEEIQLTVTEAASGRETSRPVWFVQEAHMLFLLPVKGSDTPWFKKVLKAPSVRLAVNDVTLRATARPLTDPRRVGEVVEKFRAKYGADQVAKYYAKLDVAVEISLG